MEGELRVDSTRIMKSQTVKLLDQQPNPVHVTSPVRQVKLPPLGAGSASTDHDRAVHLEQSKSDVQEAMKHLLKEAQTVESEIQRSIEKLWQRMEDTIEHNSNLAHQQIASMKAELKETQSKLSQHNSNESKLVQQNAMTSMELTKEERKRKDMELVVEKLKEQLKKYEDEVNDLKSRLKEKEKTQKEEKESLKTQLEEKTVALKEYQLKISKLTEKMNCLSKDLNNEKSSIEKNQQKTSDQLTQQASEIRKLTLEISKLKGQLSSSTATITTLKEEKRKLEIQLKAQQQDHEMTLARIKQAHTATVRELESKIALLTKEIETLKAQHLSEIESLQKELLYAEQTLLELSSAATNELDDHFLEARIKFLRHQNKREKVQLQKDISNKK